MEKIFYTYLFLYPILPQKYSDILMIIFIGLYVIKGNKKLDKISVSMIISIAVMLLTIFYADNKVRVLEESFRFITYLVLYLAVKNTYKVNNKYYVLFTLQTFIVYSLGIIQKITGIGVKVSTNGTLRMESTLGYPTSYGTYIVITIFILIMMMIEAKGKLKIFQIVNISLGLISLVLSWSRNGWLALVVGLIVLAIIYNYKFIYAILGGGILGTVIPFIRERLIQLTSSSINGGRIKLWKAALIMIKEHPIRGIGMGNYVDLINEYYKRYPELYLEGQENFPTHNTYLKMMAETGIIGTVTFFTTYVLIGIKLFTKKKTKLAIGICASFVAFMFMNIFDNMMFTPKVMTIFIAMIGVEE